MSVRASYTSPHLVSRVSSSLLVCCSTSWLFEWFAANFSEYACLRIKFGMCLQMLLVFCCFFFANCVKVVFFFKCRLFLRQMFLPGSWARWALRNGLGYPRATRWNIERCPLSSVRCFLLCVCFCLSFFLGFPVFREASHVTVHDRFLPVS